MRKLALLLLLVASTVEATPVIDGHGTGLLSMPKDRVGLGLTHFTYADCEGLPEEFDLRDLNVVPPIKNQGSCGSCWAFSQTASLESAYANMTGKVLDLSEQELVSCDRNNNGCGGGNLYGFQYQIKNGQSLESDFPYTGRNSRCKSGLEPAAKGINFAYVGQSNRRPSEKEVMCALYKSHTIPWVTVSAGGRNWSSPPTSDDGVFTRCGHGGTNHAVGIVGWKTVEGKVYFKMRNSWGTKWGSTAGRPGQEKGYAMMPLSCDNLGEEIAFIITEDAPCTPPKFRLPAEVTVYKGSETPIGVKAQDGVAYEWFVGEKKVGEGSILYVSPDTDTTYKLVGKNRCGTAESSVRVKVLANPFN